MYRVVFTLSRTGFSLLPENRYSVSEGLKGDSYLAISKPAYSEPNNPEADRINIYAKGDGRELVFTGYPNDEGFLGKIELPSIQALHFGDAALKTYQLLAPALSSMSVYLDIPMHIYQVDLEELRTGSRRMSLLAPFKEVPMFRLPGEMDSELRAYASLYREALISNSPNYQFLCFYKIIEGVRKRQERLTKREQEVRLFLHDRGIEFLRKGRNKLIG